MLETPQSWRELLARLTERPAERQRIADELGVTPYTITRWTTGESEPRLRSLKRLPEVFPRHRQIFLELIQKDLSPDMPLPTPPSESAVISEVPAAYLARALTAYATMQGPFRSWSLRYLTLQQILSHLDPDLLGMQATLIQCVLPEPQQPVRTLCSRMSVGTPSRSIGPGQCLFFLGRQSLAGWTVNRGEPGVVQDLDESYTLLPINNGPTGHSSKSVVTWPFQREGKIAGCLLVSSTERNYFTAARLTALEIYANTLALSFRDHEFYELTRITLQDLPEMPDDKVLSLSLHFHEQIVLIKKETRLEISDEEAEVQALQRLEVILLQQSASEIAPTNIP